MKHILLTVFMAVAGLMPMYNAQTAPDGHRLTALWKQYEEASKADLPKKEADILAQIKKKAAAERLSEDFYDAATQYVHTVERRDWKQREALRGQLEAEVKALDDPMVTFHWMDEWDNASTAALLAYVKAHPDGFEGRHSGFYGRVGHFLGGTLPEFIRNDAEYVRWRLLSAGPDDAAIMQELTACIGERYPNKAALDIFRAGRISDKKARKAALEALAAQYAGKAVALYPRGTLLEMEKSGLDQGKAPEEAYRKLYAACQQFEKERKAFAGAEARIAKPCTAAERLLEVLSSKALHVEARSRSVRVLLRNLSKADLTLYDGKTVVRTWNLENKAGSFYVMDTLSVDMPALPDGDYTLEAVNGKIKASDAYSQYTLSVATRTDSRGVCVYVADYKTGVPLRQATLELRKGDKLQGSATLRLDGFTPIPAALARQITEHPRTYYTLTAVSDKRKSPVVAVQRNYDGGKADLSMRCNLFLDRGAYNPGDTLSFKGVLFKGDPMLKMEVCKDKSVEVLLRDSEGNILETKKLKSGAMGSFSGRFALPEGLRNGFFSLEVKGLASTSFRVDEFVLPTFEVQIDKRDSLYFPGAEVPVSGRLVSYSGHNVSGARIRAAASLYGRSVLETEQEVTPDGSFRFLVPVKETGYYSVRLTVTDTTGETMEASDHFYIGDELRVSCTVEGTEDADLVLQEESADEPYYWRPYVPRYVVRDGSLRFSVQAQDAAGGNVPEPVSFQLLKGKSVVAEGRVPSGEQVTVNLPASGLYTLKTSVEATMPDGRKAVGKQEARILFLHPSGKSLDKTVRRVFVAGPTTVNGRIEALLGSAEGDAYVVLTLYGKDREVLESRRLSVKSGTVERLSLDYKDSYPDAVRLQAFYFLGGEAVSFDRQYRREKTRLSLPLQFTRFEDKTYPGMRYTFTLQANPDVEALAAVWDKSLDAVGRNWWPEVSMADYSVAGVYVASACGYVSTGRRYYDDAMVMVGAARPRMMTKMAAANTVLMADAAVEESVSMEADEEAAGAGEGPVRSVFSTALTFQPHLKPSADGKLSFSFSTSDKLSTYYVRVYAHDASMRNATVEREMVVTLPVKVALLEPRFLYEGDLCELPVTVSSIAPEAVSGLLVLEAGGVEQQIPVTVPAGQTLSRSFAFRAPAPGDFTLTARFKAAEFADAVQVTLPVLPAAQTLTESHSAVLRAGMDREALLNELRSRFVNVPAAEAALKEITVLDMVKDAIPAHIEPRGDDVLSLSEAWYAGLMAGRLQMPGQAGQDVLAKIMACRNADGGFGRFEGMQSSAIITAVVLERFALLRDRGFEVPDVTKAVSWLDGVQFGETRPLWCGGLSDAQYMHVRALYAQVPFEVSPVSATGKKRLQDFRKAAKSYLTPSRKEGRGMQGQILAKARRLTTLRNLLERDGGLALAKAWGVSLAKSRMTQSVKADVASLLEYAVEHRDGGWYYPNAVMPWRGLLESEAYAHALLCGLLSGDSPAVADGIRLWLMLQKETQKWDEDPAFIDAITAILDGSEAVLGTRVLALSATYKAPFKTVKAAGNGFTLARKFYRNGAEMAPGDPVSVGDRIEVKYEIWNAENRSFVKVTAGREAALQPVQQLSGHIGYGFIRPFRGGMVWGFTPQGYRNVKSQVTEYYFDTYPEEKTTLSEEFFVVRAGSFTAPVTVIESLYAPHYRANSDYSGVFSVRDKS